MTFRIYDDIFAENCISENNFDFLKFPGMDIDLSLLLQIDYLGAGNLNSNQIDFDCVEEKKNHRCSTDSALPSVLCSQNRFLRYSDSSLFDQVCSKVFRFLSDERDFLFLFKLFSNSKSYWSCQALKYYYQYDGSISNCYLCLSSDFVKFKILLVYFVYF